MTPSCCSRCGFVLQVLALIHHCMGISCGFQLFESIFSRRCQRTARPTTATTSLTLDLSGRSSKTLKEDNKDDLPFKFHVAPMQCYTNESLRQLYRALSSSAVLWTEMEKVQDLLSADPARIERRFGKPGHKDIVLQFGGNNPTSLQQCLTRLSDLGYSFDEINLNCGCPSIESGGGGSFGASLMKDPELTRQLLETMAKQKQNEQTQVSLKCRTAVVNDMEDMTSAINKDGIDNEIYKSLHNYVSQAESAGISHLVLHARPAVLSGLSPVKNRQVPPLNYRMVEEIAKDFPSFRVTLNGGINSFSQLEELKRQQQQQQQANDQKLAPPSSTISSFMAGRWMLRRPLDLAKLHYDHYASLYDNDGDDNHDPVSVAAARKAIDGVESYINFVKMSATGGKNSMSTTPRTLEELCLPLFLITEQLREDYDNEVEEQHAVKWLCDDDIERIYENVAETVIWLQGLRGGGSKKKKQPSLDVVDMKKLSSSFKGLVGTKVANKWKRNRCEL